MKKNIIYMMAMMMLISLSVIAQSKTERITKTLSFEKTSAANALLVANINGNITVQGYNGTSIQVEVEKIINGKTEARMQKGFQEIQLGVVDRADTIILYVEGVCPPFSKKNKHGEGNFGRWGYQWENCPQNEKEYDYKMNFTIKVPSNIAVTLSTINEGNVIVEKVKGRVSANNINGGIRLVDLTQSANAHTINGDVDIQYDTNPKEDCRFYTLNGNINANFKKGLSSNVNFKSFNGEFYTNLEQLVSLPVEVEKTPSNKGVKFKVNGNRYKAGAGGPLLDFETFNGDVYLKEQ